jgi:universal stress protein A
MTAIKTVVVAVDFSDIVADVVRTACAVADKVQTRMHLITVVPDPIRQAWSTEVPGLDFEAIHQRWQEEAETRMSEVLPLVTLHPAQLTHAVLTGVPDHEIVHYAKEHGADLIVVGTHGYGPFKRLILGSVADRVIRQAPCAVLTVPPSVHHSHEDQG